MYTNLLDMKRSIFLFIVLVSVAFFGCAHRQNGQDTCADTTQNVEILKIDSALAVANETHKVVLCQLGGDWCRWCRMLSAEIAADETISQVLDSNFVYLRVNYVSRDDEASQELSRYLGNASRFGFPAWIFLRPDGTIMHIQDTSYLEEGEGYDHEKILRCLRNWSLSAIE